MNNSESRKQVEFDVRRPWIGLAPFESTNRRYFFGRNQEVADIFLKIRESPLTIIFGMSGFGKSSLLGAGLGPKLEVEGFRPAFVRLRFEEAAPPLIDQVHSALGEALNPLGQEEETEELWVRVHHRDARRSEVEEHPPVLIFDQFEEVFTLGEGSKRDLQVRELMIQLADLVENRPPKRLCAHFRATRKAHLVEASNLAPPKSEVPQTKDPEKRSQFDSPESEYDFNSMPIRVVIVLREEYLSRLEAWKKLMPSLMKNRTILHPLNGLQALEAVLQPGKLDGPPLIDEEVAESIVRLVSSDDGATELRNLRISPPLLGLLCERLNETRIDNKEVRIEKVDLGLRAGDILNDYYKGCFNGLDPAVKTFVEEKLITGRGHRGIASRSDAEDLLEMAGIESPGAAIDHLLSRRLLTSREGSGRGSWIELTHDVLVPLAVESKRAREEGERIENEKLKAATEFRKRLHLAWSLVKFFGVVVLALIALLMFRELANLEKQRNLLNAYEMSILKGTEEMDPNLVRVTAENALQTNPSSAALFVAACSAHLEIGDWEALRDILSRWIMVTPLDGERDSIPRRVKYRALLAEHDGELDKAVRLWEQIELLPSLSSLEKIEAIQNRKRTLKKSGRWTEWSASARDEVDIVEIPRLLDQAMAALHRKEWQRGLDLYAATEVLVPDSQSVEDLAPIFQSVSENLPELLAMNPADLIENAKMYRELGLKDLALTELDAAIEHGEPALSAAIAELRILEEEEYKDPSLFRVFGAALVSRGEFHEASEYLESYLKVYSHHQESKALLDLARKKIEVEESSQ